MIVPLNNVKSIQYQDLLTRDSDELKIDIKVGINQRRLNNNSMTKMAQLLDGNPIAK